MLKKICCFRYVIREPKDGEWGMLLEGGNWTGLVGTLQQEEADFSTTITPTAPRLLAMEQARIYTRDPFVITSMKPRRLPHFLALVTPFTGEIMGRFFFLSTPVLFNKIKVYADTL